MKLYKKYFNSTANINIADKDFKKKFIENIAQEYKKQIKLATEKSQNYLTKEKIYLKCKLPTLKNAEPTIRCLTNITTAMSSYIIFFFGTLLNVNIMFSNSVFNKIDIDENATRALGKSIPVIWSDAIYSIIRVTLTCVILFIIISWALEKFIKLEEGLDIQFYSLCYEIICSIEEGEL